jgi:hypothetical protein
LDVERWSRRADDPDVTHEQWIREYHSHLVLISNNHAEAASTRAKALDHLVTVERDMLDFWIKYGEPGAKRLLDEWGIKTEVA